MHLLGELHHVVETGVDLLLCLLQNVNDFPGLLGVGGSEETIGSASLLGTGRAANAMDVVLRVVGEIKVDHKLNVSHIWKDEPVVVRYMYMVCTLTYT